jgi:GT2 family glycosyltransferase
MRALHHDSAEDPKGIRLLTPGEMIELSVIIANWNTKEYLVRCLRSVLEIEKRDSWEILVIDNGSGDGSGKEVKEVFPSVHLIRNEKNLGFAKAVNQGLEKASGRYVLLLNPDTLVKNGALNVFISFMDSHSEAGAAGAQLLNLDGSRQNSIANFPSLATELFNKSLLRRLFPRRFFGKEQHYSEPIEVDSVIGACMMVKREAFAQVGMLDEDYFLFLEETDWCYRMKKAGWKIYHVPQVEVYHFQGKSAEKIKKRAKVEYYRSRYHFFKKNRGRLQYVLLLIGLTGRLGVELLSMFILSSFTLFALRGLRRRLLIYAYLAWWHLRLCPGKMGLREKS